MERDERYIVEYDSMTGEPIYNDGTRGSKPGADYTKYEEDSSYQTNNSQTDTQGTGEYSQTYSYGPGQIPGDNVYRFQDARAVRPKKKKVKKGWTMPKIAVAALIFGVIAGGCVFGVNYGLNALTGNGSSETQISQTQPVEKEKVEATTDNTQIVGSAVGDVSDVVEAVMPSVVAVTETVTTQNFFGQSYDAQGAGSGFIVKQDGDELLILTNSHVVSEANKISVTFCDDEEVEATVKGVSSANDIALLTVDMSKMKDSTKSAIKVATLRSSDDIKVGEMAIAIGNANGSGQSVTVGYVSALDRTFVVGSTNSDGEYNTLPMIQTDAAINPGNSGGPLIDAKGRVIGITTSKEFSSSDGRDVVGMNYAIPMSDTISVINDLMNREVLKDEEKGYLGITGQEVNSEAAEKYNMPEGVYVRALSDTGAAAKAGIHQGDIITAIDGTEVKQVSDIQEIVNSKRVGTVIEVTIQRNNGMEYEEQKVKVELKSKDTLDGLPQSEETEEETEPEQQQVPNQDDYQIIPWGFGY
ncbi:MAG: trypsin-like peptidase domain-containing protein [Eubacterium sp.]|nr:trypsin-like peptidase domain-containing protein [Eubacterium sp.]